MNLLCCETSSNEKRAYADPNLLYDNRVFQNLLKAEERQSLDKISLEIQKEITEEMRKIVAEWMMEVCEEQKCQDEVYYLAINLMDRFLTVRSIGKNQLQLLGTACMFLASKLREPSPLIAQTLVSYTNYSITLENLLKFESLVLSVLKWDTTRVMPQDFLRHILRRLPVENVGINFEMVNTHAKTLISLCAREFKFSSDLPSKIAAASVGSALRGVGWTAKSGRSLESLLKSLQEITGFEEQDYILDCMNQIDEMIHATCGTEVANYNTTSSCTPRQYECTPPPLTDKLLEHETAVTPTDVRDVEF